MHSDLPNREAIERAEDLILRLRDIHSCRISTDETGAITEIHVVATTERSPKMISRDVETCLKAELGLEVDYRKIGVVIIDPMKETGPSKRREGTIAAPPEMVDIDRIVEERISESPGAGTDSVIEVTPQRRYPEEAEQERVPAWEEQISRAHAEELEPAGTVARAEHPAEREAQLEFLEEDVRVRFVDLRLSIEETRIDAEVRLEKNGLEVVGCLGDYRGSGPVYETIAGATIHALTELLDERFHLCLSTVKEVEVSGSSALLAVVDLIDGRAVRSYAGCVFVGRDPNEAAVLVILDALNRPFGRWKSRTEIHYRIR